MFAQARQRVAELEEELERERKLRAGAQRRTRRMVVAGERLASQLELLTREMPATSAHGRCVPPNPTSARISVMHAQGLSPVFTKLRGRSTSHRYVPE